MLTDKVFPRKAYLFYMKCFRHPEISAVGLCKHCGKGLCGICFVDIEGKGLSCKDSPACRSSVSGMFDAKAFALLLPGLLTGLAVLSGGAAADVISHSNVFSIFGMTMMILFVISTSSAYALLSSRHRSLSLAKNAHIAMRPEGEIDHLENEFKKLEQEPDK